MICDYNSTAQRQKDLTACIERMVVKPLSLSSWRDIYKCAEFILHRGEWEIKSHARVARARKSAKTSQTKGATTLARPRYPHMPLLCDIRPPAKMSLCRELPHDAEYDDDDEEALQEFEGGRVPGVTIELPGKYFVTALLPLPRYFQQ